MLKDFFDYLGLEEITWDDKSNFENEYWKSLDLQRRFPQSFINIIIYNTLLETQEDNSINIDDVNNILDRELFLITKIRESIHSNKKNKDFKISKEQLEFIKKWCDKTILSVDFKSKESIDKEKGTLLWYFRNTFDFNLPNNVLLDMLAVDGRMANNENYYGINYITKRLDKKTVSERIILNIEDELITEVIKKNHFIYAIENNLTRVYSIIEDYLLEKNEASYNRKEILNKYFQVNPSIELLKKIVENSISNIIVDDIVWKVFDLLITKDENKYVIDKILFYRNADIVNSKELITIKYLVKSNYANAYKLFNNWLKEQKQYTRKTKNRLSSEDFPTHQNSKSIPHMIELIKTYYDNDEYILDEFSNPIRFIMEAFTSIAQNNSSEVCLSIIKDIEVCKESLKDIKPDMFYINTVLRDLKEIYIKLKSKPMPFPIIAQKMDDYKYYL